MNLIILNLTMISFSSFATTLNLSTGQSMTLENIQVEESITISCGEHGELKDLPRCKVVLDRDNVTLYKGKEYDIFYLNNIKEVSDMSQLYDLVTKFAEKYEKEGQCIFLNPSEKF